MSRFSISILLAIVTTSSGKELAVTSRRCHMDPEVEKVIRNQTYIRELYKTWRAGSLENVTRKTGQLLESANVWLYTEMVCGTMEGDLDPILNGLIAPELTFQWVSFITSDMKILAQCSGILIDEWWVLTAAQCIPTNPKDFDSLLVSFGRRPIDGNPFTEAFRHTMNAQKTFIHEQFDPITLQNDIGLIKLSHRAAFDHRGLIRPICMPQPYDFFIWDLRKLECYAAGYGWHSGWRVAEGKLRYTRMKMWTQEDCFKEWPNRYAYYKQLCGRPRNARSALCHFDSGGPVMCKHRGPGRIYRYFLYGIISSIEMDCGSSVKPFIFTRVLSYHTWIRDIVKAETGTLPFWWDIPLRERINARDAG